MNQDGVDLETSLGYLLKEASSVLRSAMEEVLRPLGMTVTHYSCLELLAHVRAGRYDEARAIQHRITPLGRAVTTMYGIPGLKAALNITGYAGGEPRPPLCPLPTEAVEKIRGLLNATD